MESSDRVNRRIGGAGLAVLVLLPLGRASAYEMRLNCGGPEYVSPSQSATFFADRAYSPQNGAGYVGGAADSFAAIPEPVGGTEDLPLYQTGRADFQEYRFDTPSGDYVVTLHFCENYAHGPGQRVFSLTAESATVADSLDLFVTTGRGYALRWRTQVEIQDGQLNVIPIAYAGEARLCAIEVVSGEPDQQAPSPPQAPSTRSSYESVLLIWDMGQEADLAGYRIYRAQGAGGAYQLLNTDGPVRLRRHVDDSAEPGTTYWYEVRAMDVYGNESDASQSVSASPLDDDDCPLPVYKLWVENEDLATLWEDVFSDDYVDATFKGSDTLYQQAEMRYRGQIARVFGKKSYKVRLGDSDRFWNGDRINCNAQFTDRSLMRDALCWCLMEDQGIAPARARFNHLQLNDRFIGVYVHVEQMGEHFLARTGRSSTASIYKCFDSLRILGSTEEYEERYEKKTNEGQGHDDLIAFVETVNLTPSGAFPAVISRAFDVAAYLRQYAVLIATANNDFTEHNYYLIHDLETDRWELLPWDMDLTFGLVFPFEYPMDHDSPIDMGTTESPWCIGGPNMLLDRLLDVPAFRRYYCDQLGELLDGPFSSSLMGTRIDSLHDHIRHDVERDIHKLGWEDNQMFYDSAQELKNFAAARRQFLLSQLPVYSPQDSIFLYVNELMASNDTTVADEAGDYDDWIEIYNLGLAPVDLEGFYLTDDPADPTAWALPDTSISAGGYLLVWADDEPAEGPLHATFRLSGSGEYVALYHPDGATLVDSVTFGAQTVDVSYGRFPDGSPSWVSMSVPTPGASNTVPTDLPPVITATRHEPLYPEESEPAVVTCTVTDDTGVTGVTLYADWSGGFTATDMADDGQHGDGQAADGTYGATVGGQSGGTLVSYYVIATDDGGNTSSHPSGAPQQVHRYLVGFERPQVALNEFMASNDATIADEVGEYDDWLELFNYGAVGVDLAGLFLSDDFTEPAKWALPPVTLDPGEYLLVWADDDEEQGELHATFKLSANGEELGLFASPALYSMPVDTVSFGPQTSDVSRGRYPDGAGMWQFMTEPTPGEPNIGQPSEDPLWVAARLRLDDVWPNPSTGPTRFRFSLPHADNTSLVIYNLRGLEVARPCDRHLAVGSHVVSWDGKGRTGRVTPGVYVCRLAASDQSATRKLTIVR
jgi:hypothetical protein